MEPGRGKRRLRRPAVYVNSFGSHRCGSLIRYGRGCQQAERDQAGTPLSQLSPMGKTRRQRAAARVLRDKADPGPSAPASPELWAAAGLVQEAGSCGGVKHVSLHHGDLQEEKADVFDFPFPSRNVEKVIKRKNKKSKVWLKVWKVISRMLQENEKFRSRLLTCSQLNGEGNDMNKSSQKEVFSLDREEAIFGWI